MAVEKRQCFDLREIFEGSTDRASQRFGYGGVSEAGIQNNS